MSMDKETRAELEKRDEILEGMREEMDSLKSSFGAFQEKTEGDIAAMQESQSSLRDSIDTSKSQEAAKLHDEAVEEVARLTERNTYLESPDYQTSVIQGFLRDLDADNFVEMGRRLGFLEAQEPTEEELQTLEDGEVMLGDRKLKFSKEKPEDPEGWEFSETQNIWVKVE